MQTCWMEKRPDQETTDGKRPMRQSSQQVQKGPESVHCGVFLQLQGHGTLNRPRTKQTYIVCIRHRGLGSTSRIGH